MCVPAAAVAGAAFVIDVGARVLEHRAQQEAAEANEQAASEARADAVRDLTLRQIEEGTSASRLRREVQTEASEAQGLTLASAAEAGVSGQSLELLIGDIEASEGRALQDIQDQYTATFEQLERAKENQFTLEQARAAGVSEPSLSATAIGIGGSLTRYLTTRQRLNANREIVDA